MNTLEQEFVATKSVLGKIINKLGVQKMLTEKIKTKAVVGLAALIFGIGGGAASCGEECEALNYESPRAGVTYVSPEETTLQGLYICPPGCDYIGETEDEYCCRCPD